MARWMLEATIVNSHNDVKVLVSVLQKFHFHLIPLRLEFHHISLQFVEF